jgi:hypothetical protein
MFRSSVSFRFLKSILLIKFGAFEPLKNSMTMLLSSYVYDSEPELNKSSKRSPISSFKLEQIFDKLKNSYLGMKGFESLP